MVKGPIVEQRHLEVDTLNEVMLAHGRTVQSYHAQQVYLRRYYRMSTTHVGPGWRHCPAQACKDAVVLQLKVRREIGPILVKPYDGYTQWQGALKRMQDRIKRLPEQVIKDATPT